MALLVWAADGEWKGESVKAGEPIPLMTHREREDLYVTKRAVRGVNGDAATSPALPAAEEPEVIGASDEVKDGGVS